MDDTKVLLSTITEALLDKKGEDILTINMDKIPNAICRYFVICQGNSPTQVSALYDSVWDKVRDTLHLKPFGTDGVRNAEWIAMDYGSIIIHIFLPELRQYYKLESLWEDAVLQKVSAE